MKSVDVDARHLIRTYIDGIEEYLRGHTRLHPNEIDSLLNEINDFVYLRSGELATGERVHYNDVLKAIEECGSPSEICEQYLELDSEDQPQPFSPSPKPSAMKQKVGETESQTQVYIPKRRKIQRNFRDITSYYRRGSRWFSLYRIIFIFFIGWFNIVFFVAGYAGFPNWDYFSSYEYYLISLNFCFVITTWAVILTLWEGILINRWKTKLSRNRGMDRSLDDIVLVWASRVSFILVFFKSSILLHLSYLFFVPIWLFLACFVERQLKSVFWVEKLGPWLVSLGSFLASPQEEKIKDLIPSSWIRFNDTATNQEKGFVVILAGMLGFTFVFPWNTAAVYYGGAYLFTFLSLVIIIGTLVISRYSRKKIEDLKSATNVDSELISWLVRLLAFKTILILGYVYRIDPTGFLLGSFIIIGVIFASEILLNTYGGTSFRLWLSKALISFGSPSSIEQQHSSTHPKELSITSVSKDQSLSTKSQINVIRSQESSSLSLPQETVPVQQQIREKSVPHEKKPSMFSRFFSGIAILAKALIMTVLMFVVAFFQMVLAFVVLTTGISPTGMYQVPVLDFGSYHFSLFPFSYSSSTGYTGYTLYMGHALLLLGIQLFFIVCIQWYSLMTKKPEGIILLVCRNLTRILIAVFFIATLYQYSLGYNTSYTPFQLLAIFGLLFFSELTTWKVRSEMKKLLSTSDKELPVPNKEGSILDQAESPKTS